MYEKFCILIPISLRSHYDWIKSFPLGLFKESNINFSASQKTWSRTNQVQTQYLYGHFLTYAVYILYLYLKTRQYNYAIYFLYYYLRLRMSVVKIIN